MKSEIYQMHIATEAHHWWFRGRRSIVRWLLGRMRLPANSAILEAGCGSGGNFPMLARFGNVDAFEMNEQMRGVAQKRGIADVRDGKLPDDSPFKDRSYDLVCMFDVLEHIEDDAAALRKLQPQIARDGSLLLTVPAVPSLWSGHDVNHHHFRRYSKTSLKMLLEQNGYKAIYISYFNIFLLPAAIAVRLLERIIPSREGSIGSHIPAAPLNKLLYWLMASERWLLTLAPLPLGLSLIAVAKKAPNP